VNYLASILALLKRDDGQDLVEYSLVFALIAFGTVSAMGGLSSEISTTFSTISSTLDSALS